MFFEQVTNTRWRRADTRLFISLPLSAKIGHAVRDLRRGEVSFLGAGLILYFQLHVCLTCNACGPLRDESELTISHQESLTLSVVTLSLPSNS